VERFEILKLKKVCSSAARYSCGTEDVGEVYGAVEVIVMRSVRCISFYSEFIIFHFQRQYFASNICVLLIHIKLHVSPCVISSALTLFCGTASFSSFGATVSSGPGPPHSRGF
jgi:hypothetical protein